VGLDHQHLAPATRQQGACRQSGNAGTDNHDMVMVIVARPSAEIRHVPGRGVAAGGCGCYHAIGTIKRAGANANVFS
jgi:hypothetical protein